MKKECVVIARSGKDAVEFCRRRGISSASVIHDLPSLVHFQGITGFTVYRVGNWELADIDPLTLGYLMVELEQKGAVFEDVEA